MSSPAEDLTSDATVTMRSIIQRIATGPELSKDISRDEARRGLRHILENRVDPVHAAIFLIALRMKRETDDENTGMLDALRDVTHTVTAPVDVVVDMADPYDGYTRTMPPAPFVPAVLAACGVPTISHGVESLGPKFGLTHRKVLRAAGIPVDVSPEEAAARLADPAIGWSYIDQASFCPKLHALAGLRARIVKRPALTTLEVVIGPVRGRQKTHLVTGYVHTPYPRIYAMLARHAGFDSTLLIRGTEGGVIPSLRQTGTCFSYYEKGAEQAIETHPQALGIEQIVRAAPLPDDVPKTAQPWDERASAVDIDALAHATAVTGLEALKGKAGPMRDGLIYGAALVLSHLRRYDSLQAAAAAVREVIDSGKVLARLQAAS